MQLYLAKTFYGSDVFMKIGCYYHAVSLTVTTSVFHNWKLKTVIKVSLETITFQWKSILRSDWQEHFHFKYPKFIGLFVFYIWKQLL